MNGRWLISYVPWNLRIPTHGLLVVCCRPLLKPLQRLGIRHASIRLNVHPRQDLLDGDLDPASVSYCHKSCRILESSSSQINLLLPIRRLRNAPFALLHNTRDMPGTKLLLNRPPDPTAQLLRERPPLAHHNEQANRLVAVRLAPPPHADRVFDLAAILQHLELVISFLHLGNLAILREGEVMF